MSVTLSRCFAIMQVALAIGITSASGQTPPSPISPVDGSQVPLVFSGGHETDPRDHGRPVVLIAAALKVTPEVFRSAFSNVKPAGPDHPPEPDQVRKNKQVLMAALGPYGVTDERLNEVSNHYRYRKFAGEMWPTTPATGFALVANGVVTQITLTNPGSGYSSPPAVTVPGATTVLTSTLGFNIDFSKNGSITGVQIGSSSAPAP